MKGLARLIQNELIKIRKQKGLVISMIIMLALSLLISIVSVVAQTSSFEFYTIEEELDRVNAEIKMYAHLFKTNDTYSYHKNVYDMASEQINDMKNDIAAETDPSVKKIYEKQLEKAEKMLFFYKYMMDENVDITKYSWEYETLGIAQRMLDKGDIELVGKEEFEQTVREDGEFYFEGSYFKKYDEYVEAFNYIKDNSDDSYDILVYSLENGVPTPQSLENSARTNIDWQMTVYMNFIAVFAFVMFGSVLSNEFSQGTVRLLLIRPRKRYKILTSKIVASSLTVFALSVAVLFVTHIVDSIAYGDGFVPYLYVIGGNVVQIPTVVVLLGKLIMCVIPLLTVCMFGILLSVLTKRSTLSIALPMMVYITSPVMKLVSASILGKDVMKFFVGSYINLSSYLDTPLDTMASGELAYIFDMLFGGASGGVVPISLGLVSAIVLTYLAVATVLSYVIFNKTEIKN